MARGDRGGSDGQVLKGLLDTLVLHSLAERDDYGFGILERLGGELEDQNLLLRETTLYPLLHRLEERGAIQSYSLPGDRGRPRRYYRLTDAGRAQLREREAEWRSVHRVLQRTLFKKAEGKPNGRPDPKREDHHDAHEPAPLPRARLFARRPDR
jgi:PadR family transcriptional regulator PadR